MKGLGQQPQGARSLARRRLPRSPRQDPAVPRKTNRSWCPQPGARGAATSDIPCSAERGRFSPNYSPRRFFCKKRIRVGSGRAVPSTCHSTRTSHGRRRDTCGRACLPAAPRGLRVRSRWTLARAPTPFSFRKLFFDKPSESVSQKALPEPVPWKRVRPSGSTCQRPRTPATRHVPRARPGQAASRASVAWPRCRLRLRISARGRRAGAGRRCPRPPPQCAEMRQLPVPSCLGLVVAVTVNPTLARPAARRREHT